MITTKGMVTHLLTKLTKGTQRYAQFLIGSKLGIAKLSEFSFVPEALLDITLEFHVLVSVSLN